MKYYISECYPAGIFLVHPGPQSVAPDLVAITAFVIVAVGTFQIPHGEGRRAPTAGRPFVLEVVGRDRAYNSPPSVIIVFVQLWKITHSRHFFLLRSLSCNYTSDWVFGQGEKLHPETQKRGSLYSGCEI